MKKLGCYIIKPLFYSIEFLNCNVYIIYDLPVYLRKERKYLEIT